MCYRADHLSKDEEAAQITTSLDFRQLRDFLMMNSAFYAQKNSTFSLMAIRISTASRSRHCD